MISIHYLWDHAYSFEMRYQNLVLKSSPILLIGLLFRKVCNGKVFFPNVMKQKYPYSYLIIMLWKGKFNLKNKHFITKYQRLDRNFQFDQHN